MTIESTALTLSEMSVEALQETILRLNPEAMRRLLSSFAGDDILKEYARRLLRDEMVGDEESEIEPMSGKDAFECLLDDSDFRNIQGDAVEWGLKEVIAEPEFQ